LNVPVKRGTRRLFASRTAAVRVDTQRTVTQIDKMALEAAPRS
jgi:hypothetical protein